LLLDLNNVYVNSHNLGFDPAGFIDALRPGCVGQFLQLISQGSPLEHAALALDQAAPLSSWIRAPDEGAAIQRLGIYQHMYFARLRDSLREDFDSVARLLPATVFDRLTAAYLNRHPSEDPSLRYHGRQFPEFLSGLLAAGEPEAHGLRSDLPDLAQLEWARIDAFDAPGASLLQLAQIRALDPASWCEVHVRADPSVRSFQTQFRVSALWQALEAGEPPSAQQLGRECVLVWRRGGQVFHRAIDQLEASALELLQRGTSLASLRSFRGLVGRNQRQASIRDARAMPGRRNYRGRRADGSPPTLRSAQVDRTRDQIARPASDDAHGVLPLAL
jgi:hypothetical protein